MEKLVVNYKDRDFSVSANVRKGSKEWILLLHGIQSNKELFDNFFELSFLKDYSMLAIDLVGFGESDKPEKFSYDVKEQANICKEVVAKLGIEKVRVVGHSLGGIVGTLLLDILKEKVVSFVNIEGNLVLKDCGTSAVVASLGFEAFKEEYEKIKLDAGERKKWLETTPEHVFYKTSKSIVEWSKSGDLLEIFVQSPQRKLFVYGQQNVSKKESLPSTIQTAEIANSGHFMMFDNPEQFHEEIENFYK